MKHHSTGEKMSACTYTDHARDWGRSLEDREKARTGLPLAQARGRVANRLGVLPGTLENLRNGRAKEVASHVYARLRAAVITELEREIQRLSHEISIARQAGLDPRDDDFAAAETALAKARSEIDRVKT